MIVPISEARLSDPNVSSIGDVYSEFAPEKHESHGAGSCDDDSSASSSSSPPQNSYDDFWNDTASIKRHFLSLQDPMSLAQHVSSVEGVDRDYTAHIPSGRRLSLSMTFDPIPSLVQAAEQLPHVGAYKVSQIQRIAQVAVGVISCMLASGIIFGFAALKTVLIEEGFYRDLCTDRELREGEHLCYAQDQRLNLSFVIGSFTTNISALLVGAILDRYGPRVCGITSSILLFLGCLCMVFATSLPIDGLFLANFLIALGGTFSFVPSFHLSNAFPQFQGLILALITGAFDASASVYLIFRILYQNGVLGIRMFFLIYLSVPIFIIICQLTFMPSRSYETRAELTETLAKAEDPTQDLHDSDDDLSTEAEVWRVRSQRAVRRKESRASIRSLLGNQAQQEQLEKKKVDSKLASGVWGALHGAPASEQIMSPWFILITLFTILQMIRFNFFIATIWSQYEYMLESARRATQVTQFFDIALPIGGVATVPFIGLLLDNLSTVVLLSLLVILSTAIGVLGAVPTSRAAYGTVCLFVVYRPLYYSAMSDYAVKVFGFQTFGKVYGTIICISGLFSFSQAGLQALVHGVFQEDPGPANLIIAGAGLLVGMALIFWVDIKGRVVQKENEDDERRSLLHHRPSRNFLNHDDFDRGRSYLTNQDEFDRGSFRAGSLRTNLVPVEEIEAEEDYHDRV